MPRWTVYMLRCRDGSLYCGVTTDLARRVREHGAGTASKYTRTRLPVTLVWSRAAASESAAKKREAALKKLSKKEKERLVG